MMDVPAIRERVGSLGGMFPGCLTVAAEDFHALCNEVERLHKTLPKTHDGVAVLPNMVVWSYDADGDERIEKRTVHWAPDGTEGEGYVARTDSELDDGSPLELDECFSTYDKAAEEAENEQPYCPGIGD